MVGIGDVDDAKGAGATITISGAKKDCRQQRLDQQGGKNKDPRKNSGIVLYSEIR